MDGTRACERRADVLFLDLIPIAVTKLEIGFPNALAMVRILRQNSKGKVSFLMV
jgi:hypothetical protein